MTKDNNSDSPGIDKQKDLEIRSQNAQCVNVSETDDTKPWYVNLRYLVAGVLFGIALVKSEVVSWFRIQEMFRLESFHMYGVIGV
ncbi:MAG: transporter, partial [Bacteroidetes bacterium]